MIQQLLEKTTPFSIDALLGHGSQGFVCRAVDTNGRTVALKIIREGALAGEVERRRFSTEIKNHASLTHPNIVRVLESGHSDGVDWFTMDYIEGTPLSRWEGPREGLEMFRAICGAIAYAHGRGVLHRDLKPSNILIDARGVPHVVDFGLSRRFDAASSLTHVGTGVGTPAYADPEVLLGRPADERTDVYGLGMILYEWLTDGAYAYPIPRDDPRLASFIPYSSIVAPRVHCPGLAPGLDTMVRKCLQQSPARRYDTVADLISDLDAHERGDAVAPCLREPGVFGRLWLRRKGRVVMGGAFVFVLLSLVALMAGQVDRGAAESAKQRGSSGSPGRAVAAADEEALWRARADIGSKVDSLVSAQLAEWSQLIYGQQDRLLLPTLESTWFDDFDGTLDEAVDIISTHRFVMTIDRSKEWLQDERPLGGKSAIMLANELLARFADEPEDTAYLSAASQVALDVATGSMIVHKTASFALRKRIYQAIASALDSREVETGDLAAWLENDPPLIGFKGALLRERLMVSQLLEHSTDTSGRIDVGLLARLYGPVFDSIKLDNRPLQVEALSLVDEVFDEFEAWDGISIDDLGVRYSARMKKWSSTDTWYVIQPMLPRIRRALIAREEIVGMRRRVQLLVGVSGSTSDEDHSRQGKGNQ